MLKLLGRGVSLAILTGASLLTFAIILFLMAVVLAGEGPVMNALACRFGVGEDCIRQELREERRKSAILQKRNGELEALAQRLASLDHASSSYVVFYEDRPPARLAALTVKTGHTFASLRDPDTLIGAHCYVDLDIAGPGTRQVMLGRMSSDMQIAMERYSAANLSGTGLSVADIGALQARCDWPAGAR